MKKLSKENQEAILEFVKLVENKIPTLGVLTVDISPGLQSDQMQWIEFEHHGILVAVQRRLMGGIWDVSLLVHPTREVPTSETLNPDFTYPLDQRSQAVEKVVELLLDKA